jgi:small-conductance mechanosensitive channel
MDYFQQLNAELQTLDLGEIFTASSLFTTIVLISVIFFVRRALVRYIWRDAEVLAKEQRRWIIRIKNISAILLLMGLVLIWAPQLHTFALSIAAFAAAVVIATKEMILCLMGAIMRATSQPFRAGDWITIDGVMGEVIDLDAFSFRLQEVDMKTKSYQFTGRTIAVPNSKLFSSNVENANFFKAYIFEDVRVGVQGNEVDPSAVMQALREISEQHFARYRTEAVAFNRKIRRRAGIDIGPAEPAYDLTTSEMGHYQFHVRLFLPTPVAAAVGSEITRDFLTRVYAMRQKIAEEKEARQKALSAPAAVDAPAED